MCQFLTRILYRLHITNIKRGSLLGKRREKYVLIHTSIIAEQNDLEYKLFDKFIKYLKAHNAFVLGNSFNSFLQRLVKKCKWKMFWIQLADFP